MRRRAETGNNHGSRLEEVGTDGHGWEEDTGGNPCASVSIRGEESSDQMKNSVPPPGAADRAFLKKALAPGGRGAVQEVEDGARAWLAISASRAAKGPLIVVMESSLALDRLCQDLATLGAGESTARLPALNVESSRTVTGQASPDVSGERMRTLQRCLAWKGRGIVATCIQALLEKVPSPERLRRLGERVEAGREYDLDALSERLSAAGVRV